MVALPMATPATLTPCSTPHIHDGRDPTKANVSRFAASMSRYVVRVSRSTRGPNRSTTWSSAGGRSEFLANNVQWLPVAGWSATRQSHIAVTHPRHRPNGLDRLTGGLRQERGRRILGFLSEVLRRRLLRRGRSPSYVFECAA